MSNDGWVTDLDQVPIVKVALEKAQAARATFDALEGRVARYARALTPPADEPAASEEDRLVAAAELPGVRLDAMRARGAYNTTFDAYQQARERERDRMLRTIGAEKARAAAELQVALEAAAAVNRRAMALDDAERALLPGCLTAAIGWPELMDNSPIFESRLACWKRVLVNEGILRAKAA